MSFLIPLVLVLLLALVIFALARRPGRPTMAERQRRLDRALRDLERRVK